MLPTFHSTELEVPSVVVRACCSGAGCARLSLTDALFQRFKSRREFHSTSESRLLAPQPTCEAGPSLWSAMTRMKLVLV